MPAFEQADGRTNPEPVSAYVVIIERKEAANFSDNSSFLESKIF
jgi:hypothetical protein